MSGKAEDAGAENMQSENMRQDDMRAENAGLESGAAAKLTCGVSVAGVTAACGGSNAKPGAENARAESNAGAKNMAAKNAAAANAAAESNAGAGEDAESAAGPAARPDSVSGVSGRSPRLRVHGFTQPWQTRKLGEMVSVQSGKDYKSLNEGDVPVYGTGGYMLSVSEALSYSEDAIGIGRKGTIDKPFVLRAPFWTVDTLFYCVPKENYDLDFVNVVFQNVNWRVLDESTGVPSLSKKIINEVKAKVPSVGEQRQIGMFFSGLDRIIRVQERKTELLRLSKKYFLQNMFPRRGESAPRLRFAGFAEPWQTRKLEEICEKITRKNKNNESDLPLTIASQYGLIDQRDFFNKIVASKDMSNYYLLKKGEFAYNKSYSNGFDYGSIKRLNDYEQGCLSTLYICFGLVSDDVDSDYLECYFDTLRWYENISLICAEGARNHGLLNVNTKAFFEDVTVWFPSDLEEQRLVGWFFSGLDRIISVQERKTEALRQAKKYYLQNMFA